MDLREEEATRDEGKEKSLLLSVFLFRLKEKLRRSRRDCCYVLRMPEG